jgi:hypothetical protein
MVTQAEKEAIEREFWPGYVLKALEDYRLSRRLAFKTYLSSPSRRDFVRSAHNRRIAYWNARKAAGL